MAAGHSISHHYLTLGGGYCWLTPRFGLLIDNLLSARIIAGTPGHLVVSPTSNPALFDAIRGSGCNLSIVSKFIFKAHEHTNLFFLGLVSFPILTQVRKAKICRKHGGPDEQKHPCKV
jgi:hypothetical protein